MWRQATGGGRLTPAAAGSSVARASEVAFNAWSLTTALLVLSFVAAPPLACSHLDSSCRRRFSLRASVLTRTRFFLCGGCVGSAIDAAGAVGAGAAAAATEGNASGGGGAGDG